MSKEKRYIAFDLSIFIYANYHVARKYTNNVDPVKFTDKVIGQILKILQDIQKDYTIGGWVICADSHNFRKDYYPDYKGHREPNSDIEKLKISVVQELKQDYDVIHIEGLEGDDLLYLYSLKSGPCIIVSNDNDCKLMVHKNCDYYQYSSKTYHRGSEVDLPWLKTKKIMLGDAKDNVPKILPKGKGEATLLKSYSVLEEDIREGNMKSSEIYGYLCKELGIDPFDVYRNIVLTNYSLVIYRKYVKDFENKFKLV